MSRISHDDATKSEDGGFFDRPLWRIIVPLVILSVAMHRAAAGAIVYLSEVPSGLVVGYGLQAMAALGVALGLFLGRRWTQGALILFGISLAGTAVVEGFLLGMGAAPMAASQVLVAVLLTVAGSMILRRSSFDEA